MAITYKDAGVDLESYEEAMGRLPALMQRTHSRRVMPLVGGFAGLFQLNGDQRKYKDPVLVSGTDGVGTKLKVAMMAQRYDTVGIDLVAMCVNDCLCLGAEPLFFLDYLALGKDNPDLVANLVKGVSDGCVDAKAALIGGETAIMPDLYDPGEFDLAGFCVAVVERDRILNGSRIEEGDVLVGIESSGLHSNGFSLVRKAVFGEGQLGIQDHVPELGCSVADALLVPTRIYTSVVEQLVRSDETGESLTGIAHITGGGLVDNIGRIIPEGLCAEVHRGSWKIPPVFNWVQKLGEIAEDEMYQVFNMGIGLTLVLRPAAVASAQRIVTDCGFQSHIIGKVTEGKTRAEYRSK